MTTQQKYLIAKYVPDPRRMEPKNIGIILWASSGVASRFLTADQADFVHDSTVYQRWIDHWQRECARSELQMKDGTVVPRRNPDFLRALLDMQRGNYVMYEGGALLERIRADERGDAVEYLFSELVARRIALEERPDALSEICRTIFDEIGLTNRPDFQPNYRIVSRVGDVMQEFRFHYGIRNGQVKAVLQRVALRQQQSTCSAAFMFEKLKESDDPSIRSAKSVSVVSTDDVVADSLANARLTMLSRLSDVIDVAKREDAKKKLSALMSAAS